MVEPRDVGPGKGALERLVVENVDLHSQLKAGVRHAIKCSVPWFSIEERDEYNLPVLRPCCWATGSEATYEHSGPRDTKRVLEVWKGQAPSSFRSEMLAGRGCRTDCPVPGSSYWFQRMQLWEYPAAELMTFDPTFLANRRDAMRAALDGDVTIQHHPVRLKVATSNTCNIRCVMCYLDFEKPWKRDWYRGEEWEALKVFLEDVTVFAGEPFACDEGRRLLLEEPWPAHTHLSFLTNGTTLTPQVLAALEGRRIGYIDVSIDAATATTYARIRRKSNYQRVHRQLEELVRLREKHPIRRFVLQANFVIQELNVREIPDFVSYCIDLDVVPFFSFLQYTPEAAMQRGLKNGWDIGAPPFGDMAVLTASVEEALRRAEQSRGTDTREAVARLRPLLSMRHTW